MFRVCVSSWCSRPGLHSYKSRDDDSKRGAMVELLLLSTGAPAFSLGSYPVRVMLGLIDIQPGGGKKPKHSDWWGGG